MFGQKNYGIKMLSETNESAKKMKSKDFHQKKDRRERKGRRTLDQTQQEESESSFLSTSTPPHEPSLTHRKQTHIARNIWHVSGSGFALWIYATFPYNVVLGLASIATFLILTLDILRLKYPRFKSFTVRTMHLIMREEEKHALTGLSYMCLGFWTIALLFPRDVVLLTLLFVMFGDPLAAYIGIKYGQRGIGDKTVQGFAACFVVCAILSAIFFISSDFNLVQLIYVCLFGGLIGSLAEIIQIRNINDNLSMPVISGFLLTLFLSFLL